MEKLDKLIVELVKVRKQRQELEKIAEKTQNSIEHCYHKEEDVLEEIEELHSKI